MNTGIKLVLSLLVLPAMILSCGVSSDKKSTPSLPEAPVKAIPSLPVREFLCKGQDAEKGFGAYGYLLFTGKPDSLERIRYLRVCQAFQNKIQPLEDYARMPRGLLMVTFWFLSFASHEDYDRDDCNVLVDQYDYSRAQEFVAKIRKLDARGPILAAWNHLPHVEITNEEVLFFDLSNFAEEDYERAFRIWKDRISRDPKMWQDGFKLAVIREELHSFLQ